MRIILFIFAFLLNSLLIFSQGNIEYGLQIIDNDKIPLKNLSVIATETATLRIVKGQTDNEGFLKLNLDNGKEWSFTVGEIKKAFTINAIEFSIIETNEVYIYDLNHFHRKNKQDLNRTNIGFKSVSQSFNAQETFSNPNCMLIIKLNHPNGSELKGINVNVVNTKDSIAYKSITNSNGEACFVIPKNNNYDIDINDFKNYSYADFGNELEKRLFEIQFAPTSVNEKIINDTIYQTVTSTDEASSERALLKINIKGGKKNGKSEWIYLRGLYSKKIYASKSNEAGAAYFLVPTRNIYMIDFEFQENADAINLMNAKEMTNGEIDVTYIPDPRMEFPENFIPNTQNLLLKSFNSFLKKQFEKPKDKAFNLIVKNAKKINANSSEALFLLRLSSADENSSGIRIPLNVALVLDQSGSMYCCERSESLKKSLWELGNSIEKNDIISLVLFEYKVKTVKQIKNNYLEAFQQVIENYTPRGGTNILDGLKTGSDNILSEYEPNKANKVILLTDGYAVNPPMEITNFVESKNNEGIEFSTVGLGKDFNQSLLELIAEKGNGTFSYVDNSTDLREVMLRELKSAFSYAAKDINIEIYYDKNLVFSNLYGYKTNKTTEGKVSFTIGKLPKNTDQIAFLKFKLNKASPEIETKPLTLKVSYFDLVRNESVSYEQKINLNWTAESNTESLLDQEEKTLYAIAILNQSIKTMAEAYENGDRIAAENYLKDGKRQIEEIFPDTKPKDVSRLLDEVNKYIKLFMQMKK